MWRKMHVFHGETNTVKQRFRRFFPQLILILTPFVLYETHGIKYSIHDVFFFHLSHIDTLLYTHAHL